MRPIFAAGAAVLAIAVYVPAPGRAGPEPVRSGLQTADMDLSVRPQDDLFAYANGTWLRDTPIPADRSRWGVDTEMADKSLAQQRSLEVAARTSPDPEARKVGALYASFMDEARIERAGIAPLRAELDRIARIKTVGDLAEAIAHLDRIGVAPAFSSYVYPDAGHAGRYAFWIDQDGLGLPERSYYLGDDPKFTAARAQYRAHVETLLHLLGEKDAAAEADEVLRLETDLAGLQAGAVEARDPKRAYNPMTPAALAALAPAIDWSRYLAEEGLPSLTPTLVVREPGYLRGVSGLMRTTPLPVWKAYLRLRLVAAAAPYLPRAFADEAFRFDEGVLHGASANPDRWKRACRLVDRLMGEASGKLYVARYFSPESKASAEAMVRQIMGAFADSLRGLAWMGPATKAEALAKLSKITVKVGYPDHWRDYSALRIEPGDLVGNVFRAQAFETARKHAQLAGPVDRDEWEMTTPTVDAYYSPGANEIALPAGILQFPPLYGPAADDAYNYGSTGATIGHELSHAFDSRGSQYDGTGALRDWWTPEDHQRFTAMTERLVRAFDAFEPLPGHHVNGRLTLAENLADLAGLQIAYKAWRATLHGREPLVIGGLTGEQRFFVGYAQSYKGKVREAQLLAQLTSNPHTPEAWRVNGVVNHLDAFYPAFGVKPGDRMYLEPKDRISPW